jgi:hypothetical protein
MHIHTCMHIYMHTNVHTYIHTHTHTYIYTCIHTYTGNGVLPPLPITHAHYGLSVKLGLHAYIGDVNNSDEACTLPTTTPLSFPFISLSLSLHISPPLPLPLPPLSLPLPLFLSIVFVYIVSLLAASIGVVDLKH